MTNLKLPEDFETYPEARKNAFLKMKELKESGRRIVGVFCTYTPWELIEAADAAAVVLCGIGDDNIPIAETRLPQNLCPRIKASYGAALADRCRFFYFSDDPQTITYLFLCTCHLSCDCRILYVSFYE